jgi:hypothetical protein
MTAAGVIHTVDISNVDNVDNSAGGPNLVDNSESDRGALRHRAALSIRRTYVRSGGDRPSTSRGSPPDAYADAERPGLSEDDLLRAYGLRLDR